MQAYANMRLLIGDVHTHCGISYGNGTLEEALKNAREQLDFCAITGHAHWHDMPKADARTQPVIDYHMAGFSKLKAGWGDALAKLRAANDEGRFVVFPSFEVHSLESGDRTIVYKDLEGEILYVKDMKDLHKRLQKLIKQGKLAMSFPHHIGYRRGSRGMDWKSLDPVTEPVVEVVSMHGGSEASETPRPFLRSMGPSDWESTMQYGLAQGRVFGVVGNTDHHSAYPGSYGHGRTALWAESNTREAIWDAYFARRTYALTGDKIGLQFSLNGAAMGSVIRKTSRRKLEIKVAGGGALDCVDVIKNNKLLRRYSECDVRQAAPGRLVRTKIFLEVGWGDKKHETAWDILLGISAGRILSVEPRFRGQDVVSPRDKERDAPTDYYTSHWEQVDDRKVHYTTRTRGNPTASTSSTQGMCLEVEMPASGFVEALINDKKEKIPLARLMAGAYANEMGQVSAPAYRFHRAPPAWEFDWDLSFEDKDDKPAFYYVRVREKNDQWAWSSPVFLR
ncbi:MAG: hypothetical protein C0404_05540 [Verrucomicrobia bacterium]|nr:hypothetical protein [Verrucomicrobiota bacterium]